MALVTFTYLNIHEFDKENQEDDNKIKYFYVNDKVIKIKEFHEKGIGGKFWECVRIKKQINLFNFI
jgi:hypothetical protein